MPAGETIGKTALVIADLTIWSDTRIQWGEVIDGPSSCPIEVTRSTIYDDGKKRWRIGFHFKRRSVPLWWSRRHALAVEQAMYARMPELDLAARMAGGRGLVEGSA